MMSNEIVVFDFQGHQVRVHKTGNGKELWVAKDVCEVLEIPNVSQALARLDEDEIVNITTNDVDGRPHKFKAINEPGFWKLVLTSRSEKAKEVTRWFTHEVLPQIRQTGYYVQKGDEERVRDELDRILRNNAMPWQQLWSCELPKALEKVCPAWKRTGHYGVPPTVMLDIYHRVIGKKAVDEARRRRDEQGVQTIHQLLQDDVRAKFRDKIEAVIAIARISRSYEDFQAKLFAGIGGAMLQLNLVEEVEVCPVCGSKPSEGASFCHKCGKRLVA